MRRAGLLLSLLTLSCVEPTGLRPRPAAAEHLAAPAVPSIDDLLAPHRSIAPVALSRDEVLFLSDASGTFQLHRQTVGRPDVALTHFRELVHDVKVAPGNKSLVFQKERGDENDQLYWLPLDVDRAQPIALTKAPHVRFTSPSFREDGGALAFTSNARDGKDFDLYVAPKEELARAKPLLELKGHWEVLDWKGDALLLLEGRTTTDMDLHVYDLPSRKLARVTPHAGDAKYLEATLFDRGKAVVFVTDEGRDFSGGVVRVDVASGKKTVLVDEPHDITHLAVAGDDLAFTLNEDGLDTLVHTGGGQRREERRLGVCNGLSFAPKGDALFASVQRVDAPGDIVLVEPQTLRMTPVTISDRAGLELGRLATPELLRIASFDGLEIPVYWYSTPKPGEKQPVVVLLHGGPESQSRPIWSPQIQYLVARGYSVADPNVRGSSGYGKRYAHLDDKEKREDAVRDVEAIGAALAARPDVDGARMAILGQSYGGYLALASLTLYPERWAAGVDVLESLIFRAYFEQTATYSRAERESEYGSIERDGALLDRLSPQRRLDRVRVPLLLLHGARDTRVPLDLGLHVLTALERRGAPVEMIVFRDEGHGFSNRDSKREAYLRVGAFLDRVFRRPLDPELSGAAGEGDAR